MAIKHWVANFEVMSSRKLFSLAKGNIYRWVHMNTTVWRYSGEWTFGSVDSYVVLGGDQPDAPAALPPSKKPAIQIG